MSMIDVVVLAHSDPSVLALTLSSIAAQTSVPAIVVVDIGKVAEPHERSPLLQNLIDTGACRYLACPGLPRFDAINRGVAAGSGAYAMVLHEGDKLADAHVVADCEAHLASQSVAADVVYGERIKYLGTHWYHKQPRRPDQVALGMFVELSCMLIRRDVFRQLAFDPSYTEAGDYAFVCQLMHVKPDVRWVRIERILVYVVLDQLHEGHLTRKLKEDWRVQRDWVGAGLFKRTAVLLTRLVSQCLRRLCRMTLGYPGFRTGPVPIGSDGRVCVK